MHLCKLPPNIFRVKSLKFTFNYDKDVLFIKQKQRRFSYTLTSLKTSDVVMVCHRKCFILISCLNSSLKSIIH